MLTYADAPNKGGGDVLIKTNMILPPLLFLTRDFYETQLGWNSDNTWHTNNGNYYSVLNNFMIEHYLFAQKKLIRIF